MEEVHYPPLEEILQLGTPFVPFPEFSILNLPHDLTEWVERTLYREEPFVIRDFNRLGGWNSDTLTLKKLVDASPVNGTQFFTISRNVNADE